MKKNKKIFLSVIFIVALFYTQKAFAQDGYSFGEYNCASLIEDPQQMLICYFAGRVMSLILTVGSLLSLVFIIYGGFQLISSSGEPAKVKTARNIIIGACIGLAIVILSASIREFAVSRVLNGGTTTLTPSGGSSGNTTSGTGNLPAPTGTGGTGNLPAPTGTEGTENLPAPTGSTTPADPPSPQTIPIVLNKNTVPKDLCQAIRSQVQAQYGSAFLKAHVMLNNNEFEVFYKTKTGGSLFLDRWNNYPDSTKNNYLRISIQNLGMVGNGDHPGSTSCDTYAPPASNPTGDFSSPSGLPAV